MKPFFHSFSLLKKNNNNNSQPPSPRCRHYPTLGTTAISATPSPVSSTSLSPTASSSFSVLFLLFGYSEKCGKIISKLKIRRKNSQKPL
jgi:hypothetical protein